MLRTESSAFFCLQIGLTDGSPVPEWQIVVRLRLQRYGSKNSPSYRIVAADIRAPRDGRFIEILGSYNPVSLAQTIQLKEDRCKHWLSQGAKPTDTVRGIFRKAGVLPEASAGKA